ncbi:CDP-diacylglycerol--glycerol-3-phosphate 3-phosphatidyltransferase [Actinopolymorpha sp. B17G11]|uniref:CDP-diacylglycerol--glycerol-3-phosphate 3-phosphatidyltransferase n=1 Tax=unclassified Actinopolymorpha TaxID=2627063 RepID=UPI0032D992E3
MTQVSERRVSAWNVANAVTVLRIALVPIFCWLLFTSAEPGDASLRYVAFGVFVFAALTDKFDGELARRRGLVTDFGKVADPLADKALVGAALVGLSLLGELAWWITALVLAREFGITVLRFWVIRYGVISASPGGKAKTLLQTVAISLYLLPLEGLPRLLAELTMGLAVALTVITGLDYVIRALRLRQSGRS